MSEGLKENNFIVKLFSIRENIFKMLSNRGYAESIKKYYADSTLAEFKKAYKQNNISMYLYKEHTDPDKKDKKELTQCIVYFVNPMSRVGKVKQQFMKLMATLEDTFDTDADYVDMIMIAEDRDKNIFMHSISKYVKGYQQTYNNTKSASHELTMELFYYSEVSFNITDHYLVPRHELMDKEHVTEILERFKCSRDQLPKISKDDPVSKYYGAKIGDVFKIYRKSPTAGLAEYYRLVTL